MMIKLILNNDQIKENCLKLSIGKKRHIKLNNLIPFNFSKVRVINLGVNVLIGLTVVSKSPGGPLILKLTPKTPSPTFFQPIYSQLLVLMKLFY